ncbi:type 4 pilus major pilin [Buttiauxella gaviniae]|uniref:type 4 pilus major pilin n=1 Tax=Buttiauxella gaviniae TaxID=82990 RepID=UPI0039AFD77A
MKNKKRNIGFSLLEMLLVLAVSAVIVIAAFMIYPKISASQKIDNDTKLLSVINSGIKSIYTSTANYDGLSVKTAIDAHIIPDDNVEDGLIWNSWGANVQIEPYYDGSYYIAFENISPDACSKFVAQAGSSYFKILVDGTEIKNTANGLEFNLDTASKTCASTDNKPMTIYFYDK